MIGKLLGHTQVQTTARYAYLAQDSVKESAARIAASIGEDTAEWQPQRNACWFVNRTLEVRRKYGLSIDRREAVAIERTLVGYASTEMIVLECGLPAETRNTAQAQPRRNAIDALERWDDNRNGQITCAEARRHGIAPVPRSIQRIALCTMATETVLSASKSR